MLYSPTEFEISSVFQKRLSQALDGEGSDKVTIAKEMGISKDVLIRAANLGVVPSMKSLIKIADYLENSIDYLLGFVSAEYEAKTIDGVIFYDRLEELRAEKNIKYGTLAAEICISRSLFPAWKQKGYIPGTEICYQLVRFFETSFDYLLGRTLLKKYQGAVYEKLPEGKQQ